MKIKVYCNGVELPFDLEELVNIAKKNNGKFPDYGFRVKSPESTNQSALEYKIDGLQNEVERLLHENEMLREKLEKQEKEKVEQIIAERMLKLHNEKDEYSMLWNYMCHLLSMQNDISDEHKEMIKAAMNLKIKSINEEIKKLEGKCHDKD